MKKTAFVLFLLLTTFSPLALAASADPALGPYATDLNSSAIKHTFGWDETPFAFIRFDSDDLNLCKDLDLAYRFKFEGAGPSHWTSDTYDLDGATGLLNYWQSLSNWDSIKQVGHWEVKAFWNNPSGSYGNEAFCFTVNGPTVTPEPVSMALFGLGAGALGLTRLRRKKS